MMPGAGGNLARRRVQFARASSASNEETGRGLASCARIWIPTSSGISILDPKLFDSNAAEGYTECTPKNRQSWKNGSPRRGRSLKIYAEASGGRYPRGSSDKRYCMGYDARRLVQDARPSRLAGREGRTQGNAGKARKAEMRGFDSRRWNASRMHNPDAAYYGRSGRAEGQGQSAPALEARRRPVRGHLRRPAHRDRDGGKAPCLGREVGHGHRRRRRGQPPSRAVPRTS